MARRVICSGLQRYMSFLFYEDEYEHEYEYE